jgi:hypothetical protein
VPTTGGLGVELGRDRLAEAHALYVEHGLGRRDDAAAMAVPRPGVGLRPEAPLPGAVNATASPVVPLVGRPVTIVA